MIILGVESTDELTTGLGKKYAAKHSEALSGAIKDYQNNDFKRHFFNSNRSRYRMEPRSQFYLTKIKPKRGIGTGRFVDNVLTGRSMRRMLAFFTIRKADGGNSFVLRREAPRYFTEKYRGQPNKKSEAEQINEEDKANIRKYYVDRMQAAWKTLKQKKLRRA